MAKMRVLFRQIQEIPASKWIKKIDLEKRMIEAEVSAGYPAPRCYRPLYGSMHCEMTRVYERIFDSYETLGHLISTRSLNEKLVALDEEDCHLISNERNELFYVDSGAPLPRWMTAISKHEFSVEDSYHQMQFYPIQIPDEKKIEENIKAGKLRIAYRLIQEVPKDKWVEKFDQEGRSDEIEILTGAPLPIRYRSMFGSNFSQIRINEREYESWEQFCIAMEEFLECSDLANEKCMEAEIRRQSFFNWEREEVYIVDSNSYVPMWMEYSSELSDGSNATECKKLPKGENL